jgi:hypothetical protein
MTLFRNEKPYESANEGAGRSIQAALFAACVEKFEKSSSRGDSRPRLSGRAKLDMPTFTPRRG